MPCVGWVESAPHHIQPYLPPDAARPPIGAGPCSGVRFASRSVLLPNIRVFSILVCCLCALGSVIMRGAGCTYNDIVDRDYDARSNATRGRRFLQALSVRNGVDFCGALALAGLGILWSSQIRFAWGELSFSRRRLSLHEAHYWCAASWLRSHLQLGLCSAMPPLRGARPTGIHLYAACFSGPCLYVIYAHTGQGDDVLVGWKSAAIRFGRAKLPWLYVFYSCAFVLMLAEGRGAARDCLRAGHAVRAASSVANWHALDIDRPCGLRLFKSNPRHRRVDRRSSHAGIVAGV